jgi:very-short-patch-repair endonuclease
LRSLDEALAMLADLQHGVVGRWQLISLGFASDAIQHRVARKRLFRLHVGVYAVGHPKLTPRGHWMAAVLACGPDAVLSHVTAGRLHSVLTRNQSRIDVTAPTSGRRPKIRIHRTKTLHPEDVTEIDGIPVTSIARTILDLAAVLTAEPLRYAIEQADRLQRPLDLTALERVIARNPNRKGVKRLNNILATYRCAPDTRSRFERRFLSLIRRAGFPEPQLNVVVAGFTVDVFFPLAGLVVELDSRSFHLTPAALEADRFRDAKLQRARYIVLRITEERLKDDPEGVLDDLRALYEIGLMRQVA